MTLDPLILSRLQFAWVIAWHILLPAFTVGLASYIALMEGSISSRGKEIYLRISGFWTRIFAIAFGMGVVSGVVMPFQFGTNWSRFSDATANILSPLLAYEGLTAFTLEAGFLGVLLFGRNLVPRWAHFCAALLVAFGTLVLVLLDSGRPTAGCRRPAGYRAGGWPLLSRRLDGDRLQSVFPLSPDAYGGGLLCHHRLCGAGRWRRWLIRKAQSCRRRPRHAVHDAVACWPCWCRCRFSWATCMASTPCKYQPAKLAAIEAHWTRESARAADPVRHSRPESGNQSRRHRSAAAGQSDPDP